MPLIQIGVINPAETEKVSMQVPDDVTVYDLQDAMVDQMGLPTRGQDGQRLRYHLNLRNDEGNLKRLDDGATLRENEAEQGDVLQLTVEMVADPGDGGVNNPPPDKTSLYTMGFFGDRSGGQKSNSPTGDWAKKIGRRMDDVIVILNKLVDQQESLRAEIGKQNDGKIRLIEQPPILNDFQSAPPTINYIDFDIAFSQNLEKPGVYQAKSICVLDRERVDGKNEFKLPIKRSELEFDYLQPLGVRLRQAKDSFHLAEQLGAKLFDTAFGGTIGDCLNQCQSQWGGPGQGIRIRLDLSNAPDLSIYPWEFLWDEEDGFLAWNSYFPVIRYLPSTKPTRPFIVKGGEPLRMLVFTANPQRGARLEIETEKEILHKSLKEFLDSGLLEIQWLDHVTRDKLSQALNTRGYHIIHYIGHGGVDEELGGYLSLEGTESPHDHLTGEKLSVMLKDNRTVQLVVLNACRGAQTSNGDPFSSVAMQLAKARVPATVAMQLEISDQAAIMFSRHFYSYLVAGWSVYEALGKARKALYLDDAKVESLIPSLYSRSPDGKIFKREKSETG